MFKKEIINSLTKNINLKKQEIEKLLETPPNPDLGDYAFPTFTLASQQKKDPKQIASDLAKKIKPGKFIEKIQATGPYINFFLNKKLLAEHIININQSFGKNQAKNKEKILLEHTSVNPNASPHVGRTRNSIIGDSIKRILEFSGHKIETHYYVNDVSKQIAMLALVFKPTDKFEDLLKKYVDISKKVAKSKKLEQEVFELLHKFEHKDKKTIALFKKIVNTAIKGQINLFKKIGINFDYFDYESKYLEESKHVLKELDQTGKLFKDDEGRTILDQKNTGLEIKMKSPVLVLTRSDDTGLYPLRDLAYTIEKTKKLRNIIILGEDQKLYFEQLKQALILLKKPVPEPVFYSFVLLQDSGKMSTRKGEVVLLAEFILEALKKAEQGVSSRKTKGDPMKIAIAAIKYSMLRNENNKNITFSWNQAMNFEGESGPYLQYSYARASSIIKKAKKSKKTTKIQIPELEPCEEKLIKKIADFPEIIEKASISLNPSSIANYSFHLAQIFNEFYHACPVITSDSKDFRLKLVDSFRITLKNSLHLLGIEVMEEM